MPRTEYSKNSKYFLPKHVARACANYCRMYPGWAQRIDHGLKAVNYDGMPHGSGTGDPTAIRAAKNEELRSMMQPVETCARLVAPEIYGYLMQAVTEGVSFERLQMQGVPCGRGYFFRRKRLFYVALARMMKWYD